jgi:hypothetical protein
MHALYFLIFPFMKLTRKREREREREREFIITTIKYNQKESLNFVF